jgi:hypothetical protein
MKDTIWSYRITMPSVRISLESGETITVPLEIDFTYDSHSRRKEDGKIIYKHKLPDAPGCNPNTQDGNHCDDLHHLPSVIADRLAAAEPAVRARIKKLFADRITDRAQSPGERYMAVRLSPDEPPAAAAAWFASELAIPAGELVAVLGGSPSATAAGTVTDLGLPATDKGVTAVSSGGRPGGLYPRTLSGISVIGTGFTPPWADLDNRQAIHAGAELRLGESWDDTAFWVGRLHAGGIVDGDVSGWSAGLDNMIVDSSMVVATGVGYERLSPQTSADDRLYRNLYLRQKITGFHTSWLATVFSIKWNLIKFKDWFSDGPTTIKHHTPITLGLRAGFSYLTVGVDGVFWWGMEPLSDSFGLMGSVAIHLPLL